MMNKVKLVDPLVVNKFDTKDINIILNDGQIKLPQRILTSQFLTSIIIGSSIFCTPLISLPDFSMLIARKLLQFTM